MANILVNVFGARKLGVDLKLRIAAASLGYDEKECVISTNSFVLQVKADHYRVTFTAGSKDTRREGVIEFDLAEKQTAVIDLSVNGKGEILDWKYDVKGSSGEDPEEAGQESKAKDKASEKKPGKKKWGFVRIMWLVFLVCVLIVAAVYAVSSSFVKGSSSSEGLASPANYSAAAYHDMTEV